jgi:hypothetical protein
MATTNFTGPVTFGEVTGNSDTDTRGFMPGRKVLALSQAAPRANTMIPANSVVTKCSFIPTSAFTGTDPVSAMNITFTTGTQILAVITASAATRYHESTFVSAALFDTQAVVSASLSALSTTVFTGGGGLAFIDYITRG